MVPLRAKFGVQALHEIKNKSSLTDLLDCTSRIGTVIVTFNFIINTGSNVPIYKQITEALRRAVATGRLTVTDQLPSVRALAESLVLNPNTVARAYAEL